MGGITDPMNVKNPLLVKDKPFEFESNRLKFKTFEYIKYKITLEECIEYSSH